jgi:hypothetical protein
MVLIALAVLMVTVNATSVMVGKNVDITTSSDAGERQQVEPTIAVDPRNPQIVVAGAQDYRLLAVGEHRWHGYYRSIDGGKSWSVRLLPGFPGDNSSQGLASPLHAFLATTDPVLAFDRVGNVYYAGVALDKPKVPFEAFVAKFVNDGVDYAGITMVPSGTDKPWVAVDTTGGPHDGNIYVAYQGIISPKIGGGLFVRSTDGGNTFSDPIQVAGGLFVTGVTVDPSGNIYLASEDFQGRIIVSKSTNGGLTLASPVLAASGLKPFPQVNLPGNGFRVVTLPQIVADSKGVFMVTDDNSTGVPNVLFLRSTDGGLSWTSPVIINDVMTNDHFDPSIAVAGGKISIMWYDSRLGQLSNGTITALDVFYTSSTDAGLSFSQNVRITSISSNPNLVERADFGDKHPFIGDYIQVVATPTVVHAIWADNRNACDNIVPTFGCTDQDAFTAMITTS